MVFGLQLDEDKAPLAREKVLPAVDAMLATWQDALEEAHGDTGLALYAETVEPFGLAEDASVPERARPRGTPRTTRRRGTTDPSPVSDAEWNEVLAQAPKDNALEVEERDGAVVSARIRTDWDMDADPDEILEALGQRHGSTLVSLTLGLWNPEENDYSGLDRQIDAEAFPALRELFVGDFEFPDETEISWTVVGAIDGYLQGLPELRWLRVRGGAIELKSASHAELRTLILETGGLPRETARAIATGDLPRLEELVVWFGDASYGADTELKDIEPLFANGSYAALRRLTLGNSELSDAMAARIVQSPLAGQLEELSFEMGTLSDEGARALAEGVSAFGNLKKLRTGQNFVESEGRSLLEAAFGDRLVFGAQDQPDEWDGEVHRYVSVGE